MKQWLNNFYMRYAGIIYIVGMVCATCFVICMAGCKTTQYVPVETVRDVYHTKTDTVRDSVYNSVFVERYTQGDTVYVSSTKYLYKDRYRTIRDTLIKRDSVQVPYPVEKTLTKWQQVKVFYYVPTVMMLLTIIFVIVVYVILKNRLKLHN